MVLAHIQNCCCRVLFQVIYLKQQTNKQMNDMRDVRRESVQTNECGTKP